MNEEKNPMKKSQFNNNMIVVNQRGSHMVPGLDESRHTVHDISHMKRSKSMKNIKILE